MCGVIEGGGLATDLLPLCDIDCVHWAGADVTGLILEKQRAGQELWVLVISIQDGDGDVGAGVEVLSSAHFLRSWQWKISLEDITLDKHVL